MRVVIDDNSGFCFGVVRAIETAETQLRSGDSLYCLGDIVHNGQEVNRLSEQGLITIEHNHLNSLSNSNILLRAHGEPPSTYETAKRNNLKIIDATCPVVLRLQQKIKEAFNSHKNAQIVIYGKIGHAEVIGLEGQTNNNAIVIENQEDIAKIDLNKDIVLFSQTTKSIDSFNSIVERIKSIKSSSTHFEYHDTICRQVANRIPNILNFAKQHDIILFVAGIKSSNGKVLFAECKKVNINSHFISSINEIEQKWFEGVDSVGVCGATSTPKWLMEQVVAKINE